MGGAGLSYRELLDRDPQTESPLTDPPDRDHLRQRPPQTENPLNRDPPMDRQT